jgi:hypothetical protein
MCVRHFLGHAQFRMNYLLLVPRRLNETKIRFFWILRVYNQYNIIFFC